MVKNTPVTFNHHHYFLKQDMIIMDKTTEVDTHLFYSTAVEQET